MPIEPTLTQIEDAARRDDALRYHAEMCKKPEICMEEPCYSKRHGHAYIPDDWKVTAYERPAESFGVCNGLFDGDIIADGVEIGVYSAGQRRDYADTDEPEEGLFTGVREHQNFPRKTHSLTPYLNGERHGITWEIDPDTRERIRPLYEHDHGHLIIDYCNAMICDAKGTDGQRPQEIENYERFSERREAVGLAQDHAVTRWGDKYRELSDKYWKACQEIRKLEIRVHFLQNNIKKLEDNDNGK